MATPLKWHQPRSVAEWEWSQEFLPEWRHFARLNAKWMLALGGPTLCGVASWAPDHFARVACGMVAFAFYPLVVLFQCRIGSWCGTSYRLDAKGSRRHGGTPAFHHWKDLEAFRIGDHPGVPGIRRVEIKGRWAERWNSWSFDPAEVDEPTLRAIFESHLPTSVG